MSSLKENVKDKTNMLYRNIVDLKTSLTSLNTRIGEVRTEFDTRINKYALKMGKRLGSWFGRVENTEKDVAEMQVGIEEVKEKQVEADNANDVIAGSLANVSEALANVKKRPTVPARAAVQEVKPALAAPKPKPKPKPRRRGDVEEQEQVQAAMKLTAKTVPAPWPSPRRRSDMEEELELEVAMLRSRYETQY